MYKNIKQIKPGSDFNLSEAPENLAKGNENRDRQHLSAHNLLITTTVLTGMRIFKSVVLDL
jgi:hypothetical protein